MPIAPSLQAIALSCIRQTNQIFTNINFQLPAGSLLLVEGANGSGKSSLLKILTGLATPWQGEILWQGVSIHHLPHAYWENLHYLGHAHGIKLGLSVLENLNLQAHLAHLAWHYPPDEILDALQLQAYKNTLAKYLSAGQKRKLALAKLFCFPKNIWILDEPLTALDDMTQQYFFMQLTAHLNKGGISVISSHQPLAISQAITTTHLRL